MAEKLGAQILGLGAIGRVCAELLAGDVERLYLIARDEVKLTVLRDRLKSRARRAIRQHEDGLPRKCPIDPDSDQRHP